MPKTILILAANPKDTSRLRLDEEVREIDEGLKRSKQREQFVLQQKWAVRPEDIRRAMLDFEPNIIHFSGHGAGDSGICLENDSGQVSLISAEALAGLFELFPDIECVILNACYTEVQAEAIAKKINFVVGMSHDAGDKASIKFATAFYDALGVGKSIEFAYRLGCNAIQLAGISENLKPVLKTKVPSSQITQLASKFVQPLQLNYGSAFVGQMIGQFQILELISDRRRTIICKAIDTIECRTVALKVLASHTDPWIRKHFLQEARIASVLTHPHIVRTYQVGQNADGVTYIAMELVQGQSLSQLLKAHATLSVRESCCLLEFVARALAYAHKQGSIH